ncbi:E3 ubiquitin-protein ligase rad18 [Kappamyces sp. JEL0680]|nr:E3 ubiquitin-protein ligase rad18 [Kappamyces sp. JEL0680]
MRTRLSGAQRPDHRTPKPSLPYDTLKDKKLRDLLSHEGLLSSGDRKTLVKRHQMWTRMFNANLDSGHPKSDRELRRELSDWEHRNSTSGISSLLNKRGLDVSVDENGVSDHGTKYKVEFDALVAQIRERKKPKRSGQATAANPHSPIDTQAATPVRSPSGVEDDAPPASQDLY